MSDSRKVLLLGWIVFTASCAHTALPSASPMDCGYPQPGGPTVYAETEVDDPPRLIHLDRLPSYPASMREDGKTGHVTLAFVIDDAGLVLAESIHIKAATDSILILPAREAIRTARFAPARKAGKAVLVCVFQTFNWAL